MLFVDIKSALGMLLKGAGTVPDLAAIAIFNSQKLAALAADFRWLWVPSKMNLSDPLSRGKLPILGHKVPAHVRWDQVSEAIDAAMPRS